MGDPSVGIITGLSVDMKGVPVGAGVNVKLGVGESVGEIVTEGVRGNDVLVGEGDNEIVIVELMTSLAVKLGDGVWLACCSNPSSINTIENPPLPSIKLLAVTNSMARFMHIPRKSKASIDGRNKTWMIPLFLKRNTGSFAGVMMKIISTIPTENANCDVCPRFPDKYRTHSQCWQAMKQRMASNKLTCHSENNNCKDFSWTPENRPEKCV